MIDYCQVESQARGLEGKRKMRAAHENKVFMNKSTCRRKQISGSGWNRTADQRLMSPLLYLLSYATNSKNIT
jgi:hypothetical protein